MDIWTSSTNRDFISLAAVVTDNCLQRNIYVISHSRMESSHDAEHLKDCIEKMINAYSFDKSKVYAIILDGARNMVRLASQQENSLSLEDDSEESCEETDREQSEETNNFNVDIEPSDVNDELTEITKEVNELNFNFEIENAQVIENSTIHVENETAHFDYLLSK